MLSSWDSPDPPDADDVPPTVVGLLLADGVVFADFKMLGDVAAGRVEWASRGRQVVSYRRWWDCGQVAYETPWFTRLVRLGLVAGPGPGAGCGRAALTPLGAEAWETWRAWRLAVDFSVHTLA